MQKVVIVDYGMGNIHSVFKKLSSLKVRPVISRNPAEILSADKLLLPGVGHFSKAMEFLDFFSLIDSLNEAVIVRKKNILGICLGMQLLGIRSEEGNAEGLGWINGTVHRFNVKDKIHFKVPQTGWNSITAQKESTLLNNLPGKDFYFLHAYHYKMNDPGQSAATTVFDYEYTSVVEKENIFGTQFHPEKSHKNGLKILENFLSL